MKPPICCICHKEFEYDPDHLIAFAKTQADLEWDEWVAKSGNVGHPPYADWFCDRHRPTAEKLRGLTLAEAIEKIRG